VAVSSNQKVGELARIAYLVLLHAHGELGDEANEAYPAVPGGPRCGMRA
jgi:hypothetical protein